MKKSLYMATQNSLHLQGTQEQDVEGQLLPSECVYRSKYDKKVDLEEKQQCPIPFSEILAKESLRDGQNDWTIENVEILDFDDESRRPERVDPETDSLVPSVVENP